MRLDWVLFVGCLFCVDVDCLVLGVCCLELDFGFDLRLICLFCLVVCGCYCWFCICVVFAAI